MQVPGRRTPLPQPPAAVTFDCWQTLIYEDDWTLAHTRRIDSLARAAAEAGRRASREQAADAFEAAWRCHMDCWREGVATNASDVARQALGLLSLEEPHPAFEHLVLEWEESSHSGQVVALPGARRALEALAKAGVARALVCDTGLTPGRVVRRHLDRLGLLEHLEVCIFSDEVGVPKPDPRVFHAALEPLRVRPGDAVHVGDLRRTDIAGARNVGMGSVRIRARHDDACELPDADVVIDSHSQLLAVLGLEASPPDRRSWN